MSIVINILLVIQVIISVLIIFFVLMQRPKSEGLGAAFGGGMTENLFGAQTTNVLSTITRWLGGIFFTLTLTLSVLYAKQSTTKSEIQKQLIEKAKAVPAASAATEDPKKQIADKIKETESPAPAAPATPEPTAASAPAVPAEKKAGVPMTPLQPAATTAPESTPVSSATPAPSEPAPSARPKASKPSPAKGKDAKH